MGAVGGVYQPDPIEDPDRVDERRAAVGLDTLVQYGERLRADYGPPPAPK